MKQRVSIKSRKCDDWSNGSRCHYGIVSLIIWKAGYKWLMRLLPPIVVAPVIMVIGLGLAGTAVDMAMNITVEQVNAATGILEM